MILYRDRHSKKNEFAQWVLVCPKCGEVHFTATELGLLPDKYICPCDKNFNRKPTFELYEEGNKLMIRRNTFPRFTGEVTFGELSDIENIIMLDDCATVEQQVRALRMAGEFLTKR